MDAADAAAARSTPIFLPPGTALRPDRREGGTWGSAQAFKNDVLRRVIRIALSVADRVPARTLVVLGSLLGRVAGIVLRSARRTAAARAARHFEPNEARRIARRSFVRAGENLARCLLLRRRTVSGLGVVHVSAETRERLAELLAPGTGAVFVSAHLGPFEFIAAVIAELGHRPAVVVRESYDPELDELVDAHRRTRGVEVIHRGAPGAPFCIVRALRNARPVGFLPDLGARVPSLEVPFLGDRVAFPVGPQVIASRTGAPLVVGTLCRRTAAGPPFELLVEPVAAMADPARLTHRVVGALERAISRSPEDWLWMAPPIRRTTEAFHAARAADLE